MTRTRLTGWGRTAPTVADVEVVHTAAQVASCVLSARQGQGPPEVGAPGGRRGVIARGLGRSYGDAAQNGGGLVLDLTGLKRIHSIDPDSGLVDLDAGVSLEALIEVLLPRGMWVPVLPGTRQVTVGGAVAADVHGKNHHVDGSFGDHVVSLDLVTADGQSRTLGAGELEPSDRGLFEATVGGMGLTGVITRVVLRCRSVETSSMVVDTERADDFDDLIGKLSEDDEAYRYSVAWFDAVTRGPHLGRAVITRGRHALPADLPTAARRTPFAYAPPVRGVVPDAVPPGMLNRFTARAFNEAYFRSAPRRRRREVQDLTTFFHPLDAITSWNRLYGPRGLVQYQLVVPLGQEEALGEMVRVIAASGHVSCLNVLKRFGPGSDRPLSFPMEGWTLAVDLPARAGLHHLLGDLDERTLTAGGRLYLAKDSRTRPCVLTRMYPRLADFRAVRRRVDPDGVFASDLSRRLEL